MNTTSQEQISQIENDNKMQKKQQPNSVREGEIEKE